MHYWPEKILSMFATRVQQLFLNINSFKFGGHRRNCWSPILNFAIHSFDHSLAQSHTCTRGGRVWVHHSIHGEEYVVVDAAICGVAIATRATKCSKHAIATSLLMLLSTVSMCHAYIHLQPSRMQRSINQV